MICLQTSAAYMLFYKRRTEEQPVLMRGNMSSYKHTEPSEDMSDQKKVSPKIEFCCKVSVFLLSHFSIILYKCTYTYDKDFQIFETNLLQSKNQDAYSGSSLSEPQLSEHLVYLNN